MYNKKNYKREEVKKMLEKLFILAFDFYYIIAIMSITCFVALLIQGIVYQLSNKKINLYKKFMNNKFLWK